MNLVASSILVGATATAVVDLWSLARRRLFGVPLPDYALVGRWIGWMARGRFRHRPISATPRISGEGLIGWAAHYGIGMAFAMALVGWLGSAWLAEPTFLPAVMFGIATVAAPFFLMQPGMGAGVAASRTPRPAAARWQSLVTHAVFGAGLYVGALAISASLRIQ
jgi:hypothetical protein